MDRDKAIRAAKLTIGGMLEKNRHATAVGRAGGQVSPSKYLPDVPRAVHAYGGRANENDNIFWHGSPSGDLRGGTSGLHLGTKEAALDALRARIGVPADGSMWDGTKPYGKTLLAGKNTLNKMGKYLISGHNANAPDEDYYPHQHPKGFPTVGNSVPVDPTWKPFLRPFKITGPMTNSPYVPHGDSRANSMMKASLTKGNAKNGYYYTNDAEDSGSISAVVPNGGHISPVESPDINKADGGSVTDNDNFQSWFGDSVTHTDGQPHVLYTGTSKDKDFTSHNVGRHGAWFTRNPAVASQYAEQNDSQGYKRDGFTFTPINTASRVIPAYVKAENPYTGELPEEYLRDNYKAAQSEWFDTLRAKGHDSWIPSSQGGNLVVALREPQQIKSIYNSGKFDPNQKHMSKADGGPAMFEGIHPDLTGEGGAPLDLYHGTTQDKEFEAFDDAKLGARDAGFYGRGHYLTPEKEIADSYTSSDDKYDFDGEPVKGTVIGPLHAALKNPYVWDVSSKMKSHSTLRDLQSMGIMREKSKLEPWDNLSSHHVKPFMNAMSERGHDGVVVKTGREYLTNGISEVVAFDPRSIKHKEAEVFDPNDPRIRREDGGEVDKATGGPVMGYVPMASLTVPRLAVARAPQYQQQAPAARFSESLNSLMDTVEGFKKKPEAAADSPSAATEGHAPQGMSEAANAAYGRLVDAYGQPLTINSAYRDPKKNAEVGGADKSQHIQGNAIDIDVTGKTYDERVALANMAWDAGYRGIGFYDNSLHFDVGDPRGWGPSHSRDSIPEWAQPFTQERYGYATGGRTLDKSGLYSKALEVARNIQQQRGTPAQFMAQLKNSKGVKPAEIEAIGMPSGDKITRDEFVQHIASKVPKISTAQYGENPNYLHYGEQQFLRDTWMKEDLSPEDEEKRKSLQMRRDANPNQEVNSFGDEIEPQYEQYSTRGGDNYRERVIKLGGDNQYQSSHWDAPNVLAHIRMKDRDAPNGDRLLHVEEIQSDWAQEGRKKGFYNPENPFEVVNRITREVVSKHPNYSSMWDAYRTHPTPDNLTYGDVRDEKPPQAPYVGNTQHWTDLAMKHIMREAALGDYDGVIFTPGQVHADRYGHEDASGMEGYYDNIVPKSALSTVQQHDPSTKTQSMNVNGEYDAWHIPLTSTAKDSILKNGFPMFNRGGTVDGKAEGGSAMNENNQNGAMENGNAPINSATRTQAGELPNAGGLRGGAGALQAPYEAPLEGLPTKVGIPLSGQSVTAGPDPRIRGVARDYMASTGMKYNPPTKYAKVDPSRSRRIAAAYDAMKDDPNEPLTKASYNAMINETMAQYEHAKKAGLKIEFWNPEKDKDPYGASPRLATEDVRNNHHMWVFPTYSGYGSGDPISEDDVKRNPLLQLTGETWNGIPVTVNDVFRAVHDYYGHAKEGVGFRADGEENAWRSHASMYSPLARMAMTSETRGQNSWLNYGPHGDKNRTARTEDTIFADQKIGVMPHWAHHEGAEDFTLPEDVDAMRRIRSNFDPVVSKALSLTRGFTKDGKSAINALKPKGK
jgi:hypothetical protein